MDSFGITTLDIAKFFYKEDIGLQKRKAIVMYLWEKRDHYLGYHLYENFKVFSKEIDNLLMDLSFNNMILEETEEIITLQKDMDFNYTNNYLYKANRHQTEDFFKQCKLRIMYTANQDYIYMKMRTLAKSCGYKRRSPRFVSEIRDSLEKLGLYIFNGGRKVEDMKGIMAIDMDSYIRIYSCD